GRDGAHVPLPGRGRGGGAAQGREERSGQEMSALATRAALAAALLLLAACGEERSTEVRKELDAMTKDLRGKVDPLPQVKSYEPVPYKGESMLDPFVPGRIVVAQAAGTGGSAGGGVQPDLNRPKEPLEAFPLEAISMVGTLEQNKDMYALVKAGT